MKQRYIQSFLMVSAAFFAINAPVRSGAGTISNANGPVSQRLAQSRRIDGAHPESRIADTGKESGEKDA